MALPDSVTALLQCPACGAALLPAADALCCQGACARGYPLVHGVAVLVADTQGPFSADDYVTAARQLGADTAEPPTRTQRVAALTPPIIATGRTDANLRAFAARLGAAAGAAPAKILLVCGADAVRLRALLGAGGAEVICIGTTPGIAGVDILCEAGCVPVRAGAVDGIVVHHALHRTLQPAVAAAELQRVLRTGGLIYAEEPFVQATLEGPADFHRFTHLGLRALFLACEELDSGIAIGPGTALASSWRQLLWSMNSSERWGFALATLGSFTSFFWKHLDAPLAEHPRAIDSAAAVFFLGARSAAVLLPRELVAGYRGAASRRGAARPQERPPNEVFTEWAATGRDVGMQVGHAAAVEEMLSAAFSMPGLSSGFTAVDAGCGNGWLVRRLRAAPGCLAATGVDGAAGMIARARALDPGGSYEIGQLMSWQPAAPVDLVVSMEVLYYLDDPVALLRRIATVWLKPGGYAVIGIDHYKENEPSLGWPTYVGTRMATWPQAQWLAAVEEAGFTLVRHWRAAPAQGWAGTLAMLMRAPQR